LPRFIHCELDNANTRAPAESHAHVLSATVTPAHWSTFVRAKARRHISNGERIKYNDWGFT